MISTSAKHTQDCMTAWYYQASACICGATYGECSLVAEKGHVPEGEKNSDDTSTSTNS